MTKADSELKDIHNMLKQMSEHKKIEPAQPKFTINKSVPLALVIVLLGSGFTAFKSITLAFAEIDNNVKEIALLQTSRVSKTYVNNAMYKQKVDIGAVVNSIDDLKSTQDKFSAKLERLSSKQQQNYEALRDLIIKTKNN